MPARRGLSSARAWRSLVPDDTPRAAAPRFGIGLLVLLPFAYRRGFRIRLAFEPSFELFGLTGVALISAEMPAAVPALVFLREPIPPPRLLGIGLSVLGVLLVSGTTPPGGRWGAPAPSLKET